MSNSNWDISKEKWSKIDPIILNQNWKQSSFNYDSKNLITNKRGIYIVTITSIHMSENLPFKELITPFYVGHTLNLRTRFMQHTRGKNNKNLIYKLGEFAKKSKFFYLELIDTHIEYLQYHEQTLIDVFRGPLNQINSVSNLRKDEISATLSNEGTKHGT